MTNHQRKQNGLKFFRILFGNLYLRPHYQHIET